MKIWINGVEERVEKEPLFIGDLLQVRKVKLPEMVSVALNDIFVERSIFSDTPVNEGDKVEFFYFMSGGETQKECVDAGKLGL